MSWIKIQNGLVSNKKTARLAREMKWSKLEAVGFLVSFWVWAIENCEDGQLKDITDTEIAFGVGVDKVDGIVTALISSGLVDESPLRIHDWTEHQKDFLWGKYKDKPDKRKELLQSYSGVTPELHSGKTERKKERKKERGEERKDPPTIHDVRQMAEAENIQADPDKFFHYQEAKGGWGGMIDWKAAFRYWARTEFSKSQQYPTQAKENPIWEDKEAESIKKKNNWHDAHLKGGVCSFCGSTIEGLGICFCPQYTNEFKKFCGGLK